MSVVLTHNIVDVLCMAGEVVTPTLEMDLESTRVSETLIVQGRTIFDVAAGTQVSAVSIDGTFGVIEFTSTGIINPARLGETYSSGRSYSALLQLIVFLHDEQVMESATTTVYDYSGLFAAVLTDSASFEVASGFFHIPGGHVLDVLLGEANPPADDDYFVSMDDVCLNLCRIDGNVNPKYGRLIDDVALGEAHSLVKCWGSTSAVCFGLADLVIESEATRHVYARGTHPFDQFGSVPLIVALGATSFVPNHDLNMMHAGVSNSVGLFLSNALRVPPVFDFSTRPCRNDEDVRRSMLLMRYQTRIVPLFIAALWSNIHTGIFPEHTRRFEVELPLHSSPKEPVNGIIIDVVYGIIIELCKHLLTWAGRDHSSVDIHDVSETCVRRTLGYLSNVFGTKRWRIGVPGRVNPTDYDVVQPQPVNFSSISIAELLTVLKLSRLPALAGDRVQFFSSVAAHLGRTGYQLYYGDIGTQTRCSGTPSDSTLLIEIVRNMTTGTTDAGSQHIGFGRTALGPLECGWTRYSDFIDVIFTPDGFAVDADLILGFDRLLQFSTSGAALKNLPWRSTSANSHFGRPIIYCGPARHGGYATVWSVLKAHGLCVDRIPWLKREARVAYVPPRGDKTYDLGPIQGPLPFGWVRSGPGTLTYCNETFLPEVIFDGRGDWPRAWLPRSI